MLFLLIGIGKSSKVNVWFCSFEGHWKAVPLLKISFVKTQLLQLSVTPRDLQTYSLLVFLIQLELKQTNETNYS